MQHLLQVSRKIDYALRAMIYLASLPPDAVIPFREIARQMELPEDFLAKILKTVSEVGLVQSVRGPHGGYRLARPPREISFLEVIEAVEGPVKLNICVEDGRTEAAHEACKVASSCTMASVWRLGQERMLEVYRSTSLADLVPRQVTRLPVVPA